MTEGLKPLVPLHTSYHHPTHRARHVLALPVIPSAARNLLKTARLCLPRFILALAPLLALAAKCLTPGLPPLSTVLPFFPSSNLLRPPAAFHPSFLSALHACGVCALRYLSARPHLLALFVPHKLDGRLAAQVLHPHLQHAKGRVLPLDGALPPLCAILRRVLTGQ